MGDLGRVLIVAGAIIVVLGLFLTLGDRLPFRLGRLPLDFRIERDNFTFYFPLGTSLLVSLLLSLVLMWLRR
jgi:Protein of unknown function (DUF2905)